MQILRWPINPELERETREHYRTRLAEQIKDEDPRQIIHQITFDSVAPNLTVDNVKEFVDYVRRNFLPNLRGQGLEVGAGPGTFSSIIASFPKVTKMYAIEVCAPIVELLGPKITKFILGQSEEKVTGVIGDFDNIQLPDQSIDFAFDYYSLHHSMDINVTLKECARILKKDGFIFCFDKARPDYYTREDLDKLLDSEYQDKDKEKLFGVPAGQKFTRRMNGEKEYRLKDWRAAFLSAGFKKVDHYFLSKTIGGSGVSRLIKNIVSLLPPKIQIHITKFMPMKVRSHIFILSTENRVFTKAINNFPKEFSLIIAYK